MSGRGAGRARFDLWPTPIGGQDLDRLRGDVDRAALRALHSLKRSGCGGAHYRLSGPVIESICVVVLPRNYRLLIAFPSQDEVAVLLVGRHDELHREVDVYSRLYRGLGIEVPEGERRKPPCCINGEPPVDSDLVDRFIERGRELARQDRRRRRRG